MKAAGATKCAVYLHAGALAAVFTVLTLKAFFEFCREWDYLAYHLPDLLRRFDLTTFQEQPGFRIINDAFPPLAHLVQGLLVKLSGRISFSSGLNALFLLGLTAALSTMFRGTFTPRWFLTAALAVPLVVFLYRSGYIGLTVGSLLTLAFASLLNFEKLLASTGSAQAALRRSLPLIAWGFGGAMLAKYQAWPIIGIFYLALLLRLALLSAASRLAKRDLVLTAAALGAVIAVWPVRNYLLFRNPVYPYRPPLFSASAGYFLPAAVSINHTPPAMREAAAPLPFLHSVFELSRLTEPGKFQWTNDQFHAPADKNNHNRMGGWFFATMILLFAALFALLRSRALPRYWGATLLTAAAAVSALPQSHQLRFWLFIPLSLALLFALGVERLPKRLSGAFKCSVLAAAGYVLTHTVTWSIDFSLPAEAAPAEARAYWQIAERGSAPVLICDNTPTPIFFSGPSFNEFPIEACQESSL